MSDLEIPTYVVYEHMLDRQVDTNHPCIVLDKPPFRMAYGNVLVDPRAPRVRIDFFDDPQVNPYRPSVERSVIIQHFPLCVLQFTTGPMLLDIYDVMVEFVVIGAYDRRPEPEDVDLFQRMLAGEMSWRSKEKSMKKVFYWDDCDGTPPYVDPRVAVQKEWKERYGDS